MKIALTFNNKNSVIPNGTYEDAQRFIELLEESDPQFFDLQFERTDSGFLQLMKENGIINVCVGSPVGNSQLLCKYTDYDHPISYTTVEDIVDDFFSGNTTLSYLEWNEEMNDYVPIQQPQNTAKKTPATTTKGGCYIATAVYGSYDCPQVWTLRRFRDYTLAETWYGRAFIHAYYAISPTLVKWFENTEWFKKMWKGKLDRMVASLNADGVEDTPYEDRNW